MDGHSSPIQNGLLTIAESVVRLADVLVSSPVVVSLLLLSWGKVTMGLLVHLGYLLSLLLVSVDRIEHILSILARNRGNSELELLLNLPWPLVLSLITMAEGFLKLTGVFALLDVVELVSQAIQVLSLDHISHVLAAPRLLPVSEL